MFIGIKCPIVSEINKNKLYDVSKFEELHVIGATASDCAHLAGAPAAPGPSPHHPARHDPVSSNAASDTTPASRSSAAAPTDNQMGCNIDHRSDRWLV